MPPAIIDRTGRVECIACRAWVLPHERLRANFVGGHNVRFNVCLDCIKRHRQPKLCKVCGCVLTGENAAMERIRGKVRINRGRCLVCWNEYYNKHKLEMRLERARVKRDKHLVK